ncbi:MAG: gluconolaconase [Sphingomonadales bacterium]|nr:gluconolaconase [Sphingomonadales bacterium]
MTETAARYVSPNPLDLAEGWTLERVTRQSRLYSANGIRTGKDGRIYVAQVAGSQVSAVDPDSGAIETISPIGGGITGPDDLVFDDEGNLYCTEITTNNVSVLRPNGTSEILVGGVIVANPITFHQGHLIAGELRMGGRILELDRGGGSPRVIYEGVPMVNAFEVGPDGKLYFPAQAANEIWRIGLDGGEPEIVARDLGVPDSVKFHPDGYIVSTQVASGQVLKIDPRTGEKSVLADIGPGLDNVAFVGKRTFVSHITGSIHEILSDGKAKPLVDKGLEWPMGLAVGPDGTVYVADGMFAYTVRPGGEMELAGTLFWPGYPGFMRGIAASGANEWVVTTANGTLARWTPGQEAETLAHGYELLMGVALSGSAIVFADAGSGRVLSLENGAVSELAQLDKPYGVAVSGAGTVYVSQPDAGRVVKISGGRAEAVLDGLGWPEGLAIRGDKLYAIDTGAKQVVELDLTTGARQVLASNLPVGTPKGVAPLRLGGVGDMCGPMWSFTGIAAAADGTLFISGDAEGSVLALRPT